MTSNDSYKINRIHPLLEALVGKSVPTSTEARIDDLCIRIRKLCATKHLESSEEFELQGLIKELQDAIKHHVQMAQSSLSAKQSAINQRDPERFGKTE